MHQLTKSELERQVIEASNQLPTAVTSVTWLHSPEFQNLINAFYELARYYESHLAEVEILYLNFYIVAIYVRITRELNLVLQAEEYEDYHEDTSEALADIENCLDRMTSAGFSRMATS